MIYVIDIFDHDVCDFEDEYDDADISDELEKFRNIQPAVLKSLKAFNFAN